MSIHFRVLGDPAPQGSKRAFVVNGRAVLTEASAKVKPWRDTVAAAAHEAMGGTPPMEGAVAVTVEFTLAAPKTVKRPYPSVRPDIDKLARAVLDALKTGGVYGDDGQVVSLTVAKRYGLPGAVVTVAPLWLREAVAA